MRELIQTEIAQVDGALTVEQGAVATVALMAICATPMVIVAGSIALVGYSLMSTANYLNK